MTELIEPEYTGEEESMEQELKQRSKAGPQAQTFEDFMKKRSRRIAKITESMAKINGLYQDLNELALEQDDKLDRLDCNMDEACEGAKNANKQLKKAKPSSI